MDGAAAQRAGRVVPGSLLPQIHRGDRRGTGCYLTGLRLGHGAELLRSTQLTLADIAQQTGYSTEFSFSAAFRREYGVSPGRFRHRETRETSPPAGEEDVVR